MDRRGGGSRKLDNFHGRHMCMVPYQKLFICYKLFKAFQDLEHKYFVNLNRFANNDFEALVKNELEKEAILRLMKLRLF